MEQFLVAIEECVSTKCFMIHPVLNSGNRAPVPSEPQPATRSVDVNRIFVYAKTVDISPTY